MRAAIGSADGRIQSRAISIGSDGLPVSRRSPVLRRRDNPRNERQCTIDSIGTGIEGEASAGICTLFDAVAILSHDMGDAVIPVVGSCLAGHQNRAVHAVYTDPHFDDLLRQSLARGEGAPLFDGEAAEPGSLWTLAVKRIIDIGGAAALMIFLSPLMLVTVVAVKFSSPGPVIFRQNRLGRNRVPFTYYKFRSMRVGGNDRVHREYVSKLIEGRHDEINEGEVHRPVYKLKTDSRVTPVGRLNRRTSCRNCSTRSRGDETGWVETADTLRSGEVSVMASA